MPTPKFDETFIPILEVLYDGNVIKGSVLGQKLLDSRKFVLTSEELREKTATGNSLFLNRVSWGKTFLKLAGYVSYPQRGTVQITEKGKGIIDRKENLTLKDIRNDDGYRGSVVETSKQKKYREATDSASASPQDLLDAGFQSIQLALKKTLHEKLYEANPYYFEKIVLQLFKRMGYGDFLETPKSGDGGIDGIINQDQLGVEKIYIQAKRFGIGNKVRETHIRNFIGAMGGDTNKGIFVTTSEFDQSAKDKIRDAGHKIIPIDGEELVSLMIKYNVGTQIKSVFEVKEIDEDFFEEN